MRLSVIIATRDRSHAIEGCLASVATAFARAGIGDAEIVVVDNGSTDDTSAVVAAWAHASGVHVQLMFEPRQGLSLARNRALRSARGDLIAITDDDCRLHPDYITQLLDHDAGDSGPVLRGGHVELGDPSDLPLTVTAREFNRWTKRRNSARRDNIGRAVLGCNMTLRRSLAEALGPFDVNLGAGTALGSGEDTDYVFRAYLAGATVETVPDMTVRHYHGRKKVADGHGLMRGYMIGSGAVYAKHCLKDPRLGLQAVWDGKSALREVITSHNLFMPEIDFSARDKLWCYARGAARYMFARRAMATP